jgi:hypothetical protein
MDKRLDAILLERYPDIFAQYGGDMRETCMHWGFECGNGWFDLLDTLCATLKNNLYNAKNHYKYELERFNKTDEEVAEMVEKFGEHMQRKDAPPEEPSPVVAEQVKEKYGDLRFYYRGGSKEDRGVVGMAEAISGRTCEVCGNAGKIRGTGWLSCRCDRCENLDRTDRDKYYEELKVIEEELIARILKMDEERKELIKEGWITEDD